MVALRRYRMACQVRLEEEPSELRNVFQDVFATSQN